MSNKQLFMAMAMLIASSANSMMGQTPTFSVNDITGNPGETAVIELSLTNEVEFRDFQFTLTLPNDEFKVTQDEYDIYNMSSTSRTPRHGITVDYKGNGTYMAIAASLQAVTIKPGSGPVATIEIQLSDSPGTYSYSVSGFEISRIESVNGESASVPYHPASVTGSIVVNSSSSSDPIENRYGDNQLYVKDIEINQGEDASMLIGYNSVSDVYDYSAEIVLPDGVEVSALQFNPVVTEVDKFENTWSFNAPILTVSGEYGGGRRDPQAEAGDFVFAVATISTASLSAGEYTITVQNQTLGNDDDDFTPAAYEARLVVNGAAPTSVALTDAEPYTNKTEYGNVDITFTRNFGSTGWAGLYVPFDMAYEEWCDYGDVYKINNVHQYDDDNDGILETTTIEFNLVNSGVIYAHTPYVFKPKASGEVTFVCRDRTLFAAPDEDMSINCSTTEMLYTLYGNYNIKEGLYNQGAYALSVNGHFAKAKSEDQTLAPYRIYLLITPREDGGYRGSGSIRMPEKIQMAIDGKVVDDDESMIEAILLDGQDGVYYDLMGRPVANPEHGVFILNGVKVLIR